MGKIPEEGEIVKLTGNANACNVIGSSVDHRGHIARSAKIYVKIIYKNVLMTPIIS